MSVTVDPPFAERADLEEVAFTKASFTDILRSVGVSFVLHVFILLALASFFNTTLLETHLLVSSEMVDEIPPDDYQFDVTMFEVVGNDSAINTLSPALAAATEIDRDPRAEIEERVQETVTILDQPARIEIFEPNEVDVLATVDTTGSTEHTGGVEGAIDRLTFEIAGSLRENKTLVVWLFDASLSLKQRRNAIADRIKNVYAQLGQLKLGGGGALKTGIVSFGERTEFLTPKPIDNIDRIIDAVRNVSPDESGKENVFAAVKEVATKWKGFRTRQRLNVMFIVVTDERGDDFSLLEESIDYLKKYGMRVYCVGNEAIFGREKGFVSFTDENEYRWSNLPVDQGPETVAPERLKLAFWGGGGGGLEKLSSSFGPYALTRLCAETGGLYLVTAQNDGIRFDPAVMREYLPDYRPIDDYKEQLIKNHAKKGLVRAATSTSAEAFPIPALRFRADTDTVLRRQLTEAQKPLALADFRLREMHQLLEEGEKHRDQLITPRWRASYDLAMGRVLAMRVRVYGYNVVLAEMKSTPRVFKKAGNNQWRLVPSEDSDAPANIQKMAQKAVEYLNRVIAEHPATPWELIAKRELEKPLGWKWQEGHMEIPKPRPPRPNNNTERTRRPRKMDRPQRGPRPKL